MHLTGIAEPSNKEPVKMSEAFLSLFSFSDFNHTKESVFNRQVISFNVSFENKCLNVELHRNLERLGTYKIAEQLTLFNCKSLVNYLFTLLEPSTQKNFEKFIAGKTLFDIEKIYLLFFKKLTETYSYLLNKDFLNYVDNIFVKSIYVNKKLKNEYVCEFYFKNTHLSFSFNIYQNNVYFFDIKTKNIVVPTGVLFDYLNEEEKLKFNLLIYSYNNLKNMSLLITEKLLNNYKCSKEFKLKNIFKSQKLNTINDFLSNLEHNSLMIRMLQLDELTNLTLVSK